MVQATRIAQEIQYTNKRMGTKDSSSSPYRRQVSDLGMEDPVASFRKGRKPTTSSKESSDADDVSISIQTGDSTRASTGLGELPRVSDHSVSLSDDDDQQLNRNSCADECPSEDEDCFEMDLEDLMSTMSGRSSLKSVSSGSRNGSMALRAMHDSFSNSMNCSFSNDSSTENLNFDGNDASTESTKGGQQSPHQPQIQKGRRKLPARTGSGYVRGVSDRATESPSNSRRSLRTSIIRSNNGLAVSATALKAKRNSAIQSLNQRARQNLDNH